MLFSARTHSHTVGALLSALVWMMRIESHSNVWTHVNVWVHLFYWNLCRMTFWPLAGCLNAHESYTLSHIDAKSTQRQSTHSAIRTAPKKSRFLFSRLVYILLLLGYCCYDKLTLLSQLLNKYSPNRLPKCPCACLRVREFFFFLGVRHSNMHIKYTIIHFDSRGKVMRT